MDVKKISELACLKLSKKEEIDFQKQIHEIIEHVKKISSISTENIEPLVNPIEKNTYFREDQVKKTLNPEEALKNAPDRFQDSFKTPLIKSEPLN